MNVAIVFVIVVTICYIIYKEMQMLNCYPTKCSLNDNKNSPVIKDIKEYNRAGIVVHWRKSLILAIIIYFISTFTEGIVLIVLIAGILYITFNFYDYHLYNLIT